MTMRDTLAVLLLLLLLLITVLQFLYSSIFVIIITPVLSQIFLYSMSYLYHSWIWANLGLL